MSRGDTSGTAVRDQHLDYWRSGHEVHATVLGCLYQSATQAPWIDAAFGQKPGVAACSKQRLNVRDFCVRELTSASAFGTIAALEVSDSASIAKIGKLSGIVVQFPHEFRIKSGTGGYQRPKFVRNVRITTGDHATGGVSGFAGGLLLVDYQDMQCEGL